MISKLSNRTAWDLEENVLIFVEANTLFLLPLEIKFSTFFNIIINSLKIIITILILIKFKKTLKIYLHGIKK